MAKGDIFDLVAFYRDNPGHGWPRMTFIGAEPQMVNRPVMEVHKTVNGRDVTFRATITQGVFSVAVTDATGILGRTEAHKAFPQWSDIFDRNGTPAKADPVVILRHIDRIREHEGDSLAALGKVAGLLGIAKPTRNDITVIRHMLQGQLDRRDVEKICAFKSEEMNAENIRIVEIIKEHAEKRCVTGSQEDAVDIGRELADAIQILSP